MADWDVGSVYYSYQSVENSSGRSIGEREDHQGELSGSAARTRFGKFLLDYSQRNRYVYRERLLKGVGAGEPSLAVSLDNVQEYDEKLAECVRRDPQFYLPVLEDAAGEISIRLRNDDDVEDLDAAAGTNQEEEQTRDPRERISVQIALTSSEDQTHIRNLQASNISSLLKVTGIVISATRTQCKATSVRLECRGCQQRITLPVRPGLGGVAIPRRCMRPRADGEAPCPLDPYVVASDAGTFVDQQIIKLQELPEQVPTGEIPRSVVAVLDRALVGRVSPGTRVSLFGVYSVSHSSAQSAASNRRDVGSGGGGPGTQAVRMPYLRVVGMAQDESSATGGRTEDVGFDLEEEERMQRLQRMPDLYEKIAASIAPEIYGFNDEKRAVAAMLFGGSRKFLPDGGRIRGDLNVLLLGDPSTAKSQLLKFVEKVAPISVYTSGKGSSAAGLTAAVLRDPGPSGEFRLEGGAMVLADGGVVCIDEFDKMRIQDSVAIHEAMEQQTISIAKAGITSVLNARTSVLAAANPAFGRFDDTRPADENIEFQTTILSRFDLIFMIRDTRNDEMDYAKAKFVLRLHQRGGRRLTSAAKDEQDHIDLVTLKRYITYARTRCAPRLTPEAASTLRDAYVRVRQQVRQTDEDSVVPITVRQLESLVRLSEALAKMTLSPTTTEIHVNEAIRLFRVATMDSVNSGAVLLDGRLSDALKIEVEGAQELVRRRLPVGSTTSKRKVIFELKNQKFSDHASRLALEFLRRTGDIELLRQRKLIRRVR